MAQDLYQLHWASRAAVKTEKYPERPLPEEVPLEETLAALEECKAEGKIKHIGVCNFGVEDLKRALATGTKIVSNHNSDVVSRSDCSDTRTSLKRVTLCATPKFRSTTPAERGSIGTSWRAFQ